jgi:hypothetical protein
MKFGRLGAAVGQHCLILGLALSSGCGKSKQVVQQQKPKVTPAAEQTPHIYKLGEPRPIVLNADRPMIVKAALATPSAKPGRGH